MIKNKHLNLKSVTKPISPKEVTKSKDVSLSKEVTTTSKANKNNNPKLKKIEKKISSNVC